ncbi:MAG: fibrobacter succinogenes major paralogous domain-containing protein [Sulfurovum sp.]|nr:fibrobacter succinogenes major paralogous domain-containing protein [Sulfurovum sp.]
MMKPYLQWIAVAVASVMLSACSGDLSIGSNGLGGGTTDNKRDTNETGVVEKNQVPTAHIVISPDRKALLGNTSIGGRSSSNPTYLPKIIKYEWTEGDTILSRDSSLSSDKITRGIHIITLTVEDEFGSVGRVDMIVRKNRDNTLSVSSKNAVPVPAITIITRNEEDTQAVRFRWQETIKFDGSESTGSGTSTIVTYQWSEKTGENTLSILSDKPKFEKNDFSVGSHTVYLMLIDSNGKTNKGAVTIDVAHTAHEHNATLEPLFMPSEAEELLEEGHCYDIATNGNGEIKKVLNGKKFKFGGLLYGCVKSKNTGRIWLDRNLGAQKVAQSVWDLPAIGWYYQWGRETDGHQFINSPATEERSVTVFNVQHRYDNGMWAARRSRGFIAVSGHKDWLDDDSATMGERSYRTNPMSFWYGLQYFGVHFKVEQGKGGPDNRGWNRSNFWLLANGSNGVCPRGFRVPTAAEWHDELKHWTDYKDAFNSELHLPLTGHRWDGNGLLDLNDAGVSMLVREYIAESYYWSATTSANFFGTKWPDTGAFDAVPPSEDENWKAMTVYYCSGEPKMIWMPRATGIPIRCIQGATIQMTKTGMKNLGEARF